MHRHHPQPPAAAFGLALDLDLVGPHPFEEPGQAGHLGPFIGQGLGQQGIDGFLAIRAQPGDQPAAAVMAGQDPFQKVVGPPEIRLVQQIAQQGMGRSAGVPLAQRRPKVSRPRLGQTIQRILAPAEQGRAQDRRQRQVVLGQGKEGEQRQKVLHRQIPGQLQPVGAGDRQPSGLAGADDLAEQRAAPRHQDQDVAFGQRLPPAAAVGDGLARVDQPAQLARDGIGQPGLGGVRADLVHRVEPVGIVGLGVLRHHRPEVDPPRQGVAEGQMPRHAADPGAAGCGEGGVDRLQDRRGRAERMLQRLFRQPRAVGQCLGEVAAEVVEGLRVGALEGIDRLLPVADDEDGPVGPRPRPGPRHHLAGKRADHLPLHRAGVLRLVHQDMVDAAVELPQHPVAHRRVVQQCPRLQDQVVEVEPAPRRLPRRDRRQEGGGKAVQRRRPPRRQQRQPPQPGSLDPLHQIVQRRGDAFAQTLPRGLRRKAADLGPEGVGAALVQADFFQNQQVLEAVDPVRDRCQLGRRLLVIAALRLQDRKDRGNQVGLAAVEHLGQQRVDAIARRQPVAPQGVGQIQRPGEGRAMLQHLGDQRRQRVVPGQEARHLVHHRGKGAVAEFLQHLVGQRGGAAVVDLGEARGDAGFQREAAQQRGAEGVDGLDLQSARGLDRLREQPPGRVQPVRGQRAGDALAGQLGGQIRIGLHRPGAKLGEQPVLHLARRGLGIGQAQNVLGRHAVQQQPCHPVGQHPGLARPGIRGQPGRFQRVGGLDLAAGRLVGRAGRAQVHGPTLSRTGASLRSHSPPRARCR